MDQQPGDSGRDRQKARTRRAITAAAQQFLTEGHVPSVGEAAERADVARATAYRYFPTQDSLLDAAAVGSGQLDIDAVMASAADPSDPESRVEALAEAVIELIAEREAVFRALLRLSLSEQSNRRGAHEQRLDWAREALKPLHGELSEGAVEGLATAVSVYLGIESYVVLRDVCGLEPHIARSVTGWAARALVHRAREEARGS